MFVRLVNGKFKSARFYRKFATGVADSSDAKVIGVDIPIGYPDPTPERRSADTDARAKVGPRWQSVFWALPPILLDQPTWAAANQESKRLYDDRGVTKQSFALKLKDHRGRRLWPRGTTECMKCIPRCLS